MDKNNDGFVSYDEFIGATKEPDYEKPEGNWDPIDDEKEYTDEEFEEYEKHFEDDDDEEEEEVSVHTSQARFQLTIFSRGQAKKRMRLVGDTVIVCRQPISFLFPLFMLTNGPPKFVKQASVTTLVHSACLQVTVS